ncbi:hypothetical protein Cgig2_032208 [Carnegiea gigantea]|uniref:Uncharacterized protein n=1 Tax=Carnegiea gigantea TaxID=171969 RepID=A0A9Q1K4B0_9CARY|nr:hypothetical protein Cgig2_032208 [Carnegiea gigantea]
MWSSVLKYKPFVMDRHLVWALVKSCVPETKAFKIRRREIPLSVYDVALLTNLPATRKHVTFDEGQGACKVEEVVKAAMDGHLMRERGRGAGVLLSGSNRGNEGEDPIEEKFANAWLCNGTSCMACHYPNRSNVCGRLCAIGMVFEHTNLYVHADDKGVPGIASWMNLYVGCKYDAAQLISSIKDNQVQAALRTAKEALRLEKEAHAAMKKELELMRSLLMGRGKKNSVPGVGQNEGLYADAFEPRIATSERDDSDTLRTKLHTSDVASDEDVEDREHLGERDLTFMVGTVDDLSLDAGMLHEEGNAVPMLECDINHLVTLVKRGRYTTVVKGVSPALQRGYREVLSNGIPQRSRYHRT